MRRTAGLPRRARWGRALGLAVAVTGVAAAPAGAATTVAVDGVEVRETSDDGFVTTHRGSVVNTTLTLRTTSTGADGAPAAALPVTLYRCPATRGEACRTTDPATAAGWQVVVNGVTDAAGAFSTQLPLAESGWYAAALDGVAADSANNVVLPAYIGGRSNWSIVRPSGRPLIRVRGQLQPVVPLGTAWIVVQVRKARSGPAGTLLRLPAKANGKFNITFAPRRGSWGYRLAFVGRPKDRFSTSVSDWHRYNHQP